MALQTKGWKIAVAIIVLIVLMCTGLPVAMFAGVFRRDQFSDQYATIGVIYDDPIAAIPSICGTSFPHYIRVRDKTYSYHNGLLPGYFIVPELNAMIFETTKDRIGGSATIHVRDLSSGTVIDINSSKYSPRFVSEASMKETQGRWWVHERAAQVVTFGHYEEWGARSADLGRDGGAMLEFTTIDLDRRQIVNMERYSYDAGGNLEQADGKYAPPQPGKSAAELIGDHPKETGAPRVTPRP